MKKFLCIYHGNCADGFTAAWVVYKALNKETVEFFAATHGEPPPSVRGYSVIMVDFCYPLDIMQKIVRDAVSVIVLDHHTTAEKAMQSLEGATKVFDMTRSGAMITWNYFFPNDDPPYMLKVVQDRDLWRFKLSDTKVMQAYMFSFEYTFENWNEMMNADINMINLMRVQGSAIERKHMKDVHELLSVSRRLEKIAGLMVPVANLPYTMASEAGHIMSKGYPFAATYWDGPTYRNFSLRSDEYGLDVADIAQRYGGGGHRHASGFRMPYDKLEDIQY